MLSEYALIRPGDRVAVAVSGGLDSVVLLDLLMVLGDLHGGVLSIATVDHGTRTGSAADADFVAELAAARGLVLHRFDLSLGEGASEADCREARYACFETLDVTSVALGHHRDDQAETLLINLLRGTGARGLRGMGVRRGRLIRPLIETPRAELVRWADHRGLAWREDPTNQDQRFLRNAIRHRVMPLLEEIRPGARKALGRSARQVAEDLESCAEE